MPKNLSKRQKIAHALDYLKRNRLMTLGTSFRNRPWAATVFFAYDKSLNILFFSREDTKHCTHIQKNPYVSVVVNHDWKEKGGEIKGLQMTGRASRVSKREFKKYYGIYKKRFTWADEFLSDHKLYLIKPLEVWHINEKLFGHFRRIQIF